MGLVGLLLCLSDGPRADLFDLDFNAVEAVVDATHRYHEIFYEKEQ